MCMNPKSALISETYNSLPRATQTVRGEPVLGPSQALLLAQVLAGNIMLGGERREGRTNGLLMCCCFFIVQLAASGQRGGITKFLKAKLELFYEHQLLLGCISFNRVICLVVVSCSLEYK